MTDTTLNDWRCSYCYHRNESTATWCGGCYKSRSTPESSPVAEDKFPRAEPQPPFGEGVQRLVEEIKIQHVRDSYLSEGC